MKKIKIITLFIIFLCFITGCESSKDNETKILHGTLLDEKETCLDFNNDSCKEKVLVIKVKVEYLLSNKETINQNYFNIAEYIRRNEIDVSEIQYWAVAETDKEEEIKIMSFTVPKDIIDKIIDESIVDNQLENYVTDLWILPSLQQ